MSWEIPQKLPHVNFNFSVFTKHGSVPQVGRPKMPAHALFAAVVLKNLALNYETSLYR
ncbi:MAG: hypothetical protein ACTSRS_18180 [Candidatus Helarchaeota archaeon]